MSTRQADLWQQLASAIDRARGTADLEPPIVFASALPRPAGAEQALVLLKPELTTLADDTKLPDVLEAVSRAFETAGVHVHAVRVVSSAILRRLKIVEDHYHVLNRVARGGLTALSPPALAALRRAFPGEEMVLGAYQLLERDADLSPRALDALSRSLPTVKLANGTYATRCILDGDATVVLNAFHPRQVAHLTAAGTTMAALFCDLNEPLAEMRKNLIGATEPAEAALGSLRAIFREHRSRFGVRRFDIATNGFHVSPGPLEAMLGIERFFAVSLSEPTSPPRTRLGDELQRRGVPRSWIAHLSSNPVIEDGVRSATVFDLTEEQPLTSVAALIERSFRSVQASEIGSDGMSPSSTRPTSAGSAPGTTIGPSCSSSLRDHQRWPR